MSRPVIVAGIRPALTVEQQLRRDLRELVETLHALMNWIPVYPAAADGIVGGREAHRAAINAARALLAKHKGAA